MGTKQNELAKQKKELEHVRSEQQEFNNNKTRIEQIRTDAHTSIQAIKNDLAALVKECVAGADVTEQYVKKCHLMQNAELGMDLAEATLAEMESIPDSRGWNRRKSQLSNRIGLLEDREAYNTLVRTFHKSCPLDFEHHFNDVARKANIPVGEYENAAHWFRQKHHGKMYSMSNPHDPLRDLQ